MVYTGCITQNTKDYHIYHNIFCSNFTFEEWCGKEINYKMFRIETFHPDKNTGVPSKTDFLFGFRARVFFDSPFVNETIMNVLRNKYMMKHSRVYLKSSRVLYNHQVEMYFGFHEIDFTEK